MGFKTGDVRKHDLHCPNEEFGFTRLGHGSY